MKEINSKLHAYISYDNIEKLILTVIGPLFFKIKEQNDKFVIINSKIEEIHKQGRENLKDFENIKKNLN